jgi:hypothetical protein
MLTCQLAIACTETAVFGPSKMSHPVRRRTRFQSG